MLKMKRLLILLFILFQVLYNPALSSTHVISEASPESSSVDRRAKPSVDREEDRLASADIASDRTTSAEGEAASPERRATSIDRQEASPERRTVSVRDRVSSAISTKVDKKSEDETVRNWVLEPQGCDFNYEQKFDCDALAKMCSENDCSRYDSDIVNNLPTESLFVNGDGKTIKKDKNGIEVFAMKDIKKPFGELICLDRTIFGGGSGGKIGLMIRKNKQLAFVKLVSDSEGIQWYVDELEPKYDDEDSKRAPCEEAAKACTGKNLQLCVQNGRFPYLEVDKQFQNKFTLSEKNCDEKTIIDGIRCSRIVCSQAGGADFEYYDDRKNWKYRPIQAIVDCEGEYKPHQIYYHYSEKQWCATSCDGEDDEYCRTLRGELRKQKSGNQQMSEADIHKVFHDVYSKEVRGLKYWKEAQEKVEQLEKQYPIAYQALHKDSEFYDVTVIGNAFHTLPQYYRTYFNRFRNCEQITDASCEGFKLTPWDVLENINREDWPNKAKERQAKRSAEEKTPAQTEAAAKRAQSDAEAPQTEAENAKAKAKETKKEVRAEEKKELKHEAAAARAGAKAAGDANTNMAVLSIVIPIIMALAGYYVLLR